jgi:hypothetical protein
MTRNYKRDYEELPKFALKYIGRTTLECIEDYAAKRKVVSHRIGSAFWDLVDRKCIEIETISGICYIVKINLP